MESNSILPGSGKIYSLQRGFVISRLFSIYFTITGAKNIVCYIEDFIVYSCFEKGCRIKCTRQPVGGLEFTVFQRNLREWHERDRGHMSTSAKGK